MEDQKLLSPAEFERMAAELGLSLKQLADMAGISHGVVYRWRAGKTRPRIDVYERLRDALRAARRAA